MEIEDMIMGIHETQKPFQQMFHFSNTPTQPLLDNSIAVIVCGHLTDSSFGLALLLL